MRSENLYSVMLHAVLEKQARQVVTPYAIDHPEYSVRIPHHFPE